jgi:anthranilate phosphoribosyltransferase
LDNLQKFSPFESAKLISDILRGKTENESARNLVLINAAAAIFVSGKANNLKNSLDLAKESLESGEALGKLESLIEKTSRN